MGELVQSVVNLGRDVGKWGGPGGFNIQFGELLRCVIIKVSCKEGFEMDIASQS